MGIVWDIKKKFIYRNRPKVQDVDNSIVGKATIGYNKYGAYCVPLLDEYKPVPQYILRGDVYEQETIQYILDNAYGAVIHAGTYFGYFLPALATLPYNIYAFEPVREHYRLANITIQLNKNCGNVHLFPTGFSDTKRDTNIVTKKGSKTYAGASYIDDQEGTEVCLVERMDDFFSKIPDRISIIHLDVEGHEKQAVIGGLETITKHKPILILEDNNGFIGSDEYINTIHKIGYRQFGKVNNNKILKCVKNLTN